MLVEVSRIYLPVNRGKRLFRTSVLWSPNCIHHRSRSRQAHPLPQRQVHHHCSTYSKRFAVDIDAPDAVAFARAQMCMNSLLVVVIHWRKMYLPQTDPFDFLFPPSPISSCVPANRLAASSIEHQMYCTIADMNENRIERNEQYKLNAFDCWLVLCTWQPWNHLRHPTTVAISSWARNCPVSRTFPHHLAVRAQPNFHAFSPWLCWWDRHRCWTEMSRALQTFFFEIRVNRYDRILIRAYGPRISKTINRFVVLM